MAKPVTDLAFPSVTICSPGLNMEAVKEAIFKDFNQWRGEEGKGSSKEEEVDEYMEEKYAMKVGEGNIFDFIADMMLPSASSKSRSSVALAENLVSCKGSKSTRRKRQAGKLPSDCQLDEGSDYGGQGNYINFYPNNGDPSKAEPWKDCAVLCVDFNGVQGETCGYWTYYSKPKSCFLRAPDFYGSKHNHVPNNRMYKNNDPGAVSGNVACGVGEFFITQKYV